jgi:hypothetical protein
MSLFFSSIILIILPSLLIISKKFLNLSYKLFFLGSFLSIFTIIKLPILGFLDMLIRNISSVIIGLLIFTITELIIRIYIRSKYSQESISNIISLASGYIFLKFLGIFIFQFSQFLLISTQQNINAEFLLSFSDNISTQHFYLIQFFQPMYTYFYGVLLFALIIIAKNNKSKTKEFFLTLTNFIVLAIFTYVKSINISEDSISLFIYILLFLIILYIFSLKYLNNYLISATQDN